jgi:hypothetical protein
MEQQRYNARLTDQIRQVSINLMNRIRKLEIQQATLPAVYEAVGLPQGAASLTTVVTDVVGTDIVVEPGLYLVQGVFGFIGSGLPAGNDDPYQAIGYLKVNGVQQADTAQAILAMLLDENSIARFAYSTVTQAWIVSLWDYREYIIIENPINIERFHESNTFTGQPAQCGGSFDGNAVPHQPPAIGRTDMSGQPTYSMLFDGIDDRILAFGGLVPFYSSTGTLEIWFKTSSATTQHLIGNATPIPPTGTGKGASLYINASGKVVAALGISGGATATIASPLAYNDGEWHYALMAWDTVSLDLYIDGVIVNTGAPVTPTHGGAPVVANIGGVSTFFFNGYLDEAAVYAAKATSLQAHLRYLAGTSVVYYPDTLYIDNVLALAPLLMWRFDEQLGTTAADASSNGRTGVYTGACLLNQDGALIVERSGEYDDAVRLDGTSGYITRADEAALHLATGSYEIWFRTSTAAIQYLLGNEDLSAGRYGMSLSLSATGQVVGEIATAAASARATTTITYLDNKWHNAILTWDGTTIRVYVDGTLMASNAPAGPPVIAWNSYALRAGRAPNGTAYYFNGWLDEAIVYGSVLSAADAELHYLSGKSNRGWLNLAVRKNGGAGTSNLQFCKLIATKLFAASRS